ncbi:MAG TPA: YbdD/YjiX family protein [Burkholderiales bacterium]|nr:YbdD/YjiX family protein [Burkholderiales bacterium]
MAERDMHTPNDSGASPAAGQLFARVCAAVRQAWGFVRQLSGDDAYERYLQHHARAHPGVRPMSRKAYIRFRDEQKWNRISRCC